jgi:hypothetical protein
MTLRQGQEKNDFPSKSLSPPGDTAQKIKEMPNGSYEPELRIL